MSSGFVAAKTETRVQSEPGKTMRKLREIGLLSLARMYSPKDGIFYFRLRKSGNQIVPEGLSHRYTAITLIGLATCEAGVAQTVPGTDSVEALCGRIVDLASRSNNLGDVALTCWAARACNHAGSGPAWKRLLELQPETSVQPTVELAWTLAAMCVDPERVSPKLRDAIASRLMTGLNRRTGVNPHILGGGSRHVACFADQVYPIHALSLYSALTGSTPALDDAARCADMICRRQGEAGQWWWHYDVRSGQVIEGYPVYAIHQDAMGPMALFALRNAGGPDFSENINRGVSWMVSAPELNGANLVDDAAQIIWRKVARREPRKAVRYVQAAFSRIHPSWRMPLTDSIFPARTIDYEDRPYHIGWMLYAMSLAGSTWA